MALGGTFFLLSGYGVTFGANNKKEYMKGFIKNRFVKVLVPFISAHIIYFLIKSLLGITFTVKDIFWGLLGQLNVVEYSWYPVASVIMYVMFAVIWKVKLSDSLKIILLFVSNIIISFMAWVTFGNRDWWYISNLAFAVGCAMYYLPDYYKRKPAYIVCGGMIGYVVGLAIIPFSYKIAGEYSVPAYILSCNIATACMASAFAGSMFVISNINCKCIKFLSGISYEVYLFHGLVIYILKLVGMARYSWSFLFITIIGTIVLAIPVHSFDEYIISQILFSKKSCPDANGGKV